MAYCQNCGAEVQEGSAFCLHCGAPVENGGTKTAEAKPDFNATVQKLTDTADTTFSFDPADIEKNKGMALLSYLSWLVLIPLLAGNKSPYVRFHANQGLVLAIVEIVWGVVSAILSRILDSMFWPLTLISSLLPLVNILFGILAILGIVNAVSGKAKELPVIGRIRLLN